MGAIRSDHPSLLKGKTIFLKSVKQPSEVKRLLQPAGNNRKLGSRKNIIRRGKWKGLPMYSLTLEERATCPTTCKQWTQCYGNNMYLANRLDHTSESFFSSLWDELENLSARHAGGFVIRLHVLGDFFSKKYVRFWARALRAFPMMNIFGYTHRHPEHEDGIGKEIEKLNAAGAWIRFSDRGGEMSANVDGEGIQCPEQVDKTTSCLTCGLCWSTTQPINFKPH